MGERMDMSRWPSSNTRDNNFDLIRLGLASLVIFSHSYPLLFGADSGNRIEPFYRATGGQTTGGQIAVNFFFILSGYLITQSWHNSDGVLDFLRRRILRIYPGFVLASAVTLFVLAPLGSTDRRALFAEQSALRFIYNQIFLYLPAQANAFVSNPLPYAVNGAAWTIKYEFMCYLALAMLGGWGLLKRRRTLLFVFGVCWVIFSLQRVQIIPLKLTFENDYTSFFVGEFAHYPRFATAFFAGAAFFSLRHYLPRSPYLFVVASLTLLIVSLAHRGFEILLPFVGTYMLFYLGFLPTGRLQNFARYGDYSYGIYLYGFPVQQLLIARFPSLTPPALFFFALFLSFLFALFSWRIVEKPFLKFKFQRMSTLVKTGAVRFGLRTR
jgi:peptidoglycan/LPS O-acetylase OafA/YrhL